MDSASYITGSVVSKDGTKIGYRQMGKGPGVILVHGGMMASQNFMKLATILSNEFSVYALDRRGRGLSGPYGDNYGLEKEVEDIKAVVSKTGAQQIFGLSSGAIVTLKAALEESGLKKAAIYEPPIQVKDTDPVSWVEAYEQAMNQNNYGAALVSIVKGTEGASLLTFLPRFIVVPFMNFAIEAEAKEPKADYVPLKTLIATMHYDPVLVIESKGILDECKSCQTQVLLLGGSRSPKYLKAALDEISTVLSSSKRTEFSGLGHLGAENGGKPERVAQELRRFFKHSGE